MKIQLREGQEPWGLTFDIVLVDGHEDGEWPTNIQIEHGSDLIAAAQDFGWTGFNPAIRDEDQVGQAYDYLKAHIGDEVDDLGYFHGTAHTQCNGCGGWHRQGYGGDCNAPGERWESLPDR